MIDDVTICLQVIKIIHKPLSNPFHSSTKEYCQSGNLFDCLNERYIVLRTIKLFLHTFLLSQKECVWPTPNMMTLTPPRPTATHPEPTPNPPRTHPEPSRPTPTHPDPPRPTPTHPDPPRPTPTHPDPPRPTPTHPDPPQPTPTHPNPPQPTPKRTMDVIRTDLASIQPFVAIQ